MELLDIHTLLFLVGFGFLAAFIDSIVGGGGLICVPTLMWTGLPPVVVIGTSKLASIMGACTSFVTFARSGKMDTWLVKRLFPLSLIGASCGAMTVRLVPSTILQPLVVVMLIAVLVYTLCKKDWGSENHYTGVTKKMLILSGVAAYALGFYDGFFGPGSASFLIFAFLSLGFDFLQAAANARALNFANNIAGFVTFTLLGVVNFSYGIPMGLGMIAGAFCGSHMALDKGVGFVRPLFIIVTTILIGKQLVMLFL